MTMNLLFSINASFRSLLQECVCSIVHRGGAAHYHAYVLHSDLTEVDQRAITAACPPQVEFHFVVVEESLFAGFPEFKRYPRQIYYRLAAPLLLPKEIDRVLYLDVDTIVINSLLPLYNASFEGNLFMACTHTKKMLTKMNRLRLGIDCDTPYINTGVMMMDLAALRKEFSIEDVRRYAEEKKDVLLLPDQDILTALYGNRVKLLDSMIYNLSDRTLNLYNADPTNEKRDLAWVRAHSVVIHYFGRNNPWKENYRGILDIFYYENKQSSDKGREAHETLH